MSAPRVELLPHREAGTARAIHAIQQAAYAQEAALLGVRVFAPLETTVADIVASAESYFGLVVDGAPVAVLGIEPIDGGAWLIASLVVTPAQQRRGMARLLLGAVLERHRGAAIEVSTGTKNTPALALYTQFGFVEQRRRIVGSTEPIEIVVMRRTPHA